MPKHEMFSDYPDIVNIQQLRSMLGGIGAKAAYALLHNGNIGYLRIGKAFRVPKKNVINYINQIS